MTKPTPSPAPASTPPTGGLRPLPMRISNLQFTRLHAARDRDGLSVQEHVRRALDYYLAALENGSVATVSPAFANGVPAAPPLEAPPPPRKRAARPVLRTR